MQQKELYGEISAFMGRLRNDPSRESITNMQGAIDYLLEKLHIVTEKLQEATGKKEIVLDDKDRRRLASRARVLNAHLLEMVEDITTREVWCGGITAESNGDWMAQVARNQTDAFDGRLNKMKYLIHDNDPLFKGRFDQFIDGAGCKIKRLPPRSPELNGYVESFIKTIKNECLNHFILTSVEQLRYVIDEYLEYYNHERPHSGLGGAMIKPWPQDEDGEVVMFTRLGGFLKSYRRVRKKAA